MSLITNESYPHLSPTLPHLVITPALTCKYLSHSSFPTHAFQAPRTCLSTYENMLFLPIEHALLVPWRGLSPTHLITFWIHVVYEHHSRRYYSSLLRELEANQCNNFLLAHCVSSFKDFTSSDSSNDLCSLWEKVLPSETQASLFS